MTSEKKTREIYEFGPFRLDADERLLLRDGEPLRVPQRSGGAAVLTPKVVETLLALVRRQGDIVNKDELMRTVWPDTVVEEGNLSANISILRKALGTTADGRPYIETFPKRGYRFNAEVQRVVNDPVMHSRAAHPSALPAIDEERSTSDSDVFVRTRTRTRVITRIDEDTHDPGLAVIEATALAPTDARALTESRVSRKFRPWLIAGTVLLLVILGIVVSLLIVRRAGTHIKSDPFARIRISRLTSNGIASRAVVSPDGQYIAHVTGGTGHESLQLRNVATQTDQEIVPPDRDSFSSLLFSHDGKFIYYVKYREKEGGVLSQIPALGGVSNILAKDVDGCASFSPDGQQFVFIRGRPAEGDDALIIARTDGTSERRLLSHGLGEMFAQAAVNSWGPAWSPDGSVIAFPLRTADDRGVAYRRVMLARVADGKETTLTSEKWFSLGAISWLPDSSGLIVAAADEQSDAAHQLWYVGYPSGTARRITNDLNNYDGTSVAADGATLITVQSERRASVWIADAGDDTHASQLPSENQDGMRGLAWTPDGRIVYTSDRDGNTDIWIMNADGSNRRQITTSPAADFRPVVSSDGRYIIFVSERGGGRNIWRIDADGGNPRQLTNQSADYYPWCSPDDRWIVYSSNPSGRRQLWRIPIEGGLPVQITDYSAGSPVVSPDGKFIACPYVDERTTPRHYSMAIVPFAGGRPIQTFDLPRSFAQVVRWTPDSRALTYLVTRAGVSNIWRQPLDGSAPAQLTDFKTDTIFRYDWSRDGKQLAVARGSVISDVVLIKNVK